MVSMTYVRNSEGKVTTTKPKQAGKENSEVSHRTGIGVSTDDETSPFFLVGFLAGVKKV